MIPIVTPAEMGAIDAAAPEPVDVLIGRAGVATVVGVAAVGAAVGVAGRQAIRRRASPASERMRREYAIRQAALAGDRRGVASV